MTRSVTVRGVSRDELERVTIPEAAERLGITQSAVRQRIRRGSISWEKGPDRRTYVYLDPSVTARNPVAGTSRDELIERMSGEIEFLRGELQRKDAILLRLTESIGQLEAPREARESPETPSEEPARGEDRGEAERRSWWRRWFGA